MNKHDHFGITEKDSRTPRMHPKNWGMPHSLAGTLCQDQHAAYCLDFFAEKVFEAHCFSLDLGDN